MVRLLADRKVIDNLVGLGVNDVYRVVATVGHIDTGRKSLHHWTELPRLGLGVDVKRVKHWWHAREEIIEGKRRGRRHRERLRLLSSRCAATQGVDIDNQGNQQQSYQPNKRAEKHRAHSDLSG
jgi:hypothetical protein